MITTLKALKSLTKEQRAILDKQRVDGEFTPRALLDTLRALAEFDHLSDTARMRIGGWIVLCVIGTIVGFIVGINGVGLALLVPLVAIPTAIYLGITLRKLSKLDLSNNFRMVAMPFFGILNQDMKPGDKLSLKLDLSSATAKTKAKGASAPYQRGAYHKVIDTRYSDPWFEGTARLADGTVLSWNVSDDITVSSRTKRTSRGKLKMKSASRKLTTVSVGVGLPADTYAIGTGPIPEGEKFKLVEGEKRNTINLAKKIKTKSAEPMPARELIDLVGEAYMRAKPGSAAA